MGVRPELTEFQQYQAMRFGARMEAMMAQLRARDPEAAEAIELLVEARLVATDEEAQELKRLIDARPPDFDAMTKYAREVIQRHAE